MAIRVSSNQMVYGYQKQLNEANNRQNSLLEQGDGSKLHRPSDDSVDYSKYLRYNVSSNENTQYKENVNTAISWMKTSDAALVNMTEIQTTFIEKTIQAGNDTTGESDMKAIGKEMMAEIQELVSLGNTMQGDSYVFGGTQDLTKPFSMSTEEVDRGLAKTLDDNQAAFFSGTDGATNTKTTSSLTQMLTLTGSDGNTYYLNVLDGSVYTQEFVDEGYKDAITAGDSVVDKSKYSVGTISGFADGSAKVSTYFKNTGEIKDATAELTDGVDSTGAALTYTDSDGNTQNLTFTFETVKQQIVSYTGNDNGISMVKKNGTTEPVADTVNVTGSEIFGNDIFDDANSGNKSSGTAMLNQMLTVQAKVDANDKSWLVSDGPTVSNVANDVTVATETKLGARQQLYSATSTMLTTQGELITSDITDVSSVDVAELAVKLMQEQTIYNMSLSLAARILPQSLADYLS